MTVMTPEAQAHFQELEKNKRRIYPARNISDLHPKATGAFASIPAGATGLASATELAAHRQFLKPITVEGWSNEGFEPDDPIKQRKAKEGGEAQPA